MLLDGMMTKINFHFPRRDTDAIWETVSVNCSRWMVSPETLIHIYTDSVSQIEVAPFLRKPKQKMTFLSRVPKKFVYIEIKNAFGWNPTHFYTFVSPRVMRLNLQLFT